MKTLDEVITTLEKFWVCPSSDEADEYCELLSIQGDALHYLCHEVILGSSLHTYGRQQGEHYKDAYVFHWFSL